MATARTPGTATARVHSWRHDQDPDPVPSRVRPGAAATGGSAAPMRCRIPGCASASGQAGLTMPFTLPEDLPPLRLLLVWDNLTGHKTPDLVLWLCEHGVMPLDTPVGGSWLNMAESIERVLKRRALDGQHPHSPAEIGCWFEQ